MIILLLLQSLLSFATSANDEEKYNHMLEALRKGEVITCIDTTNCKHDYALFLHALDRHYEEDKPELPLHVPLYPDSGLIISYYMILRDHFADLPVPDEVYERIDRHVEEDSDDLVPILKELAESDPFFLRYITWVKIKANQDPLPYELVMGAKNIASYQEGKYSGGIQIYQFCRNDRVYPCRIILKDSQGNLVRDAKGKLWTIPTLALAANRKPYYKISGHTPSGVYTIDGVMPKADQIRSFGRYRRLIINFILASPQESNHSFLLPLSHHYQDWWKEAVTARKVGRNLLRIHGSGKVVTKPEDPYYTFAPTQGCINTRENTYGDVTYRDQRHLLNIIMKAMGLEQNYANEANIYGLLYVINVDDKTAPVGVEDLKGWGLE